MANLATLKAALNAAIYQNNQNAITGGALNIILNSIIDTLGAGYRYAGVATPSANPGTIDNRVFYLATAAGTYTNFGVAVLDGKSLHIFIYDTAWHDVALDVPTTAAIPVIAGSGANSVQGKGDGLSAEASGSSCFGVTSRGSISSTGTGSHAEGYAEGDSIEKLVAQIIASGYGAHAEGESFGDEGNPGRIEASSYGAHAEGEAENGSILSESDGSHAEGYAVYGTIQASGGGSHAEGQATQGSIILSGGAGSHAEGYASDEENIRATGNGAHAEGASNEVGDIIAEGVGSHAEGSGTTASGTVSHAEGAGTVARNKAEHAEGKFNASHVKTTGAAAQQAAGSTLSSVGCGSENDRKNAIEVMQNGDVYVKGVGGYDGTNPSQDNIFSLGEILNTMAIIAPQSGSIINYVNQQFVIDKQYNNDILSPVFDETTRENIFTDLFAAKIASELGIAVTIANVKYLGISATGRTDAGSLSGGIVCCIYEHPNDGQFYYFVTEP